MGKEIQIRNNTANFLVFVKENNAENIDVRIEDNNVWLTVNAICSLYGKSKSTVSEHIKAIFLANEQSEDRRVRKFRTLLSDGREFNTNHYNLEMIIAVGYRVNSEEAINFRRWATNVLKAFTVQGYVLDKERLENGEFSGEDYFEHLLEEILKSEQVKGASIKKSQIFTLLHLITMLGVT